MSDSAPARVHWSFWVIGVVALIWTLMGSANIALQLVAPNLEAMPEWWRAVVASRPAWATGAMLVAVVGGLIGCILLLMRRSAAIYFFAAALLGTLVTMSHAVAVPGAGPRQIVEAVVMPLVVGLFLIWYARLTHRKGWTS